MTSTASSTAPSPVAFTNPEHGQAVTEYAVMASRDGATWFLAPLSTWLGQHYDPTTSHAALAHSLAVRCREYLTGQAVRCQALSRQARHNGDDYEASRCAQAEAAVAATRVAVFARQTTAFAPVPTP